MGASPSLSSAPAHVLELEPEPLAEQADTSEPLARPASLWRRLVAFAIDSAVVAGVLGLFLYLAVAASGMKAPASGLTGLDALMADLHAYESMWIPGAALGVILSVVYCAAFAFLRGGRTLGRWAMGLRLVDRRGASPSVVRAVLRAVLAVLSFGFFLIGFWLALFDRRGQMLHDKLTSTYVVRPL
jgi:uncharacterized RDD family membrane protein YckC